MSKRRRSFERYSNVIEQRPVFFIATEGRKTEPDYLNMRIFKPPEVSVIVRVLPTNCSSSPTSVKRRMQKYMRDNNIREGDEAWLVVDKDQWKPEHLEQLYVWSSTCTYKNLAVSNPQFEYWLLLHFEDGNDVHGKIECRARLERVFPNYNKSNIDINKFTIENVQQAIHRAKIKDHPPCEKWPINTGTTVYRLIERIIS